MPKEIKFLGWDGPVLQKAADALLERWGRGARLDLSDLTVVLPGSRAKRRLMEILLAKAPGAREILVPPRMTTVGGLPELLYEPRRPLAKLLLRRLAWIEAIERFSPARLAVLFRPADTRNRNLLYSLAARLDSIWQELARANRDFLDVARRAATMENRREEERWTVLSELHQTAMGLIEEAGFCDREMERRLALGEGRLRYCGDLILIATPDLSPLVCEMIRCVESELSVFVAAPGSLAAFFDEFGCLRVERWVAAQVPLASSQIIFTGGPNEQAEEVAKTLASLGGRYALEDVVIGLGDETLAPYVERVLSSRGVFCGELPTRPFRETPVGRLLEALLAVLERRRFCDYAEFLRHPDVEAWLARRIEMPTGVAAVLDAYYERHLPSSFDEVFGLPEEDALCRLLDEVKELLANFFSAPQDIALWADCLRIFLTTVYKESQEVYSNPGEGHGLLESLHAVGEALGEISSLPTVWTKPVSASEALRLLLDTLKDIETVSCSGGQKLELLGWLELSLDDSPVAVVCAMNEGMVPRSLTSDPFLPDGMRRALGLLDNERRYARDAYLLSVVAATKEVTSFIAARRDSDAAPLMPSRLLLACGDLEMARRVARFYGAEESSRRKLKGGQTSASSDPVGLVIRPEPLPVRKMSVTSFADYLRCPYRFYLKHVLGLRRLDDEKTEMDGAMLGEVLHHVLLCFARRGGDKLDNEEKITTLLVELLESEVDRRFGRSPLAAVLVQIEQLKKRLPGFASWQAQRCREGWRIRLSEWGFSADEVSLSLSNHCAMGLTGRIDRVDFNERTQEWAVFDYKTGENPQHPSKAYKPRKREWVDLQLPLYREALRQKGLMGPFRLGYLALGREPMRNEELFADWDEEVLDSAVESACEIAERVREGIFWPPNRLSWPGDEFADLCGVGLLGDVSEKEEQDEGE